METTTRTAPPFDLERLVSSLWAKRFRANCPTSYSEAILRAGEPVDIYESDETGELQWVVALEDGFWMDAFTSREEAERLVEEMGWPIIGASLASPSPVFPISSLRDIYNLPTIEQMETCIDEIKICMMQARATNDLFVALANLEGANVKKAFEWPETLPWHDDGKGDVGTRYVTPDGDEFMSMDAIGETSPTQTTTNL